MKIKCPICNNELIKIDGSYKCSSNHCFDISRGGYVNLLTGSKSSDQTGDNPIMSRARHDFLSKGYYSHFASGIAEAALPYAENKSEFCFIDAGCSDGYYTDEIMKTIPCSAQAVGVDLAKSAVKLASHRNSEIVFCVASVFALPVFDSSADAVFSIFTPIAAAENRRVLRPDGVLIVCSPGKRHLWQLKSAVYDTPYDNPESPHVPEGFCPVESGKISKKIDIATTQDIKNLFLMTPYAYKTSKTDAEKLDRLDGLTTETEFIVSIYKKQ